jgi:hypothetical protein
LRYKVENFKPNKRQEFFLSFSITPYWCWIVILTRTFAEFTMINH